MAYELTLITPKNSIFPLTEYSSVGRAPDCRGCTKIDIGWSSVQIRLFGIIEIKTVHIQPLVDSTILQYIFRTRKNLESGLTLREGGLAQGFKPTVDPKNYNKKFVSPKNNKNINLCWFGELFCALTLFFDHMDHSDLHW